jgi:hypothetical protein
MSILAYSTSSEAKPFLRFGLFLAGLAVFYLIFWGGKKYITAPRLGQVKFGPRRQKRKLIMVSVLAGIVLLQVILLVGTILLWKNPQWATNLGLHTSNRDLERMVVAVIGALFVGPSMVLFALIWFGQPIFLIIAGLLIMIPGVILFVNFMRKYPLPPAEASHD